MFEGFELVVDGLTDTDIPPIRLVDDAEFYGRHGISGDMVALELPGSIGVMFDRYHALDRDQRDRFQRWAYWLNHAHLVWNLSRSATYMAVIQAVEALRPPLPTGLPCPNCGRPEGPGPTEQFVQFMDTYVPRQQDEAEQERRNLYRLRSAIAHGGKLLGLDTDPGLGGFYPRPISERSSADLAMRIARMAGVNWLLQAGA